MPWTTICLNNKWYFFFCTRWLPQRASTVYGDLLPFGVGGPLADVAILHCCDLGDTLAGSGIGPEWASRAQMGAGDTRAHTTTTLAEHCNVTRG